MAFYVSNEGELFGFKVLYRNKLELSNGAVIPDPPPGELFATEKSAKKYAALVKELGNPSTAKTAHSEWVRQGAK